MNETNTVENGTYTPIRGFVRNGKGGIRIASQDDPAEAIIDILPNTNDSSAEVEFAS